MSRLETPDPQAGAKRRSPPGDRSDAAGNDRYHSPNVSAISKNALARTLARHPRPLGGDTARQLDKPVVSLTDMVLNNLAISRSGDLPIEIEGPENRQIA